MKKTIFLYCFIFFLFLYCFRDITNIKYSFNISDTEQLNTKEMKRKRLEGALNYVDSFQTHKRYEQISNEKVKYLFNILIINISYMGYTLSC